MKYLHALSGEPNPVTHKALPGHLFSSPSLAIDSRVSDKLKSKIWNNEYFEFSDLLSNPVFENKYQLTINNSDKGLVPSLCLEPVSKTKKYLSIESWLNCFHIFVGVYTRKYPNEAPALMKYGEVVQDLAARGHNWKFYDENFRFLRQSQPAAFPWINIHWELWMRSQQPIVRKPTATAPPSQSTISDAIQQIKLAGAGCLLSKTDIKNAFRIIPIRPQDYHLLGMKWQGMYYYDRCMPMGCSSSCKTFETFSSALEWIAQNKLHIRHILHLLDDFLIIAPSYQLCQAQLSLFVDLCSYLGVPIAPEKTRGPSTTLCFAGVELDSVLFEARLPVEKITKCLSSISNFLQRKKVTLKEIQSLTGLLNFACTVVVPGRAFLRRLIDLTEGVRSPYHVIRMTREVKDDLAVWQSFLTGFNGKSFFLEDTWYSSEKLNLFTDASGSLGFGAVFGSKWCYGPWPASWINRNIALLEFYPIVLSLSLWGSEMQNRCILFFTDNEALVHVINKQSCKDKELMFFVRKLVLVCLQNNIVFKAKHIRGLSNTLADSLSRLQIQKFRLLAPLHMDQTPTDIPLYLQPQNWQP